MKSFKIIGLFPLTNTLELKCPETDKVFYYRLYSNNKVGDFKIGNRFSLLPTGLTRLFKECKEL